ncbi:MAG: IPTL-CTERM sorting domain-containing protein [Acidovorax sp.]|uniref:IPTL-CTERM sorting domain-containing protein n=1 Tax=Acidovorax sp. TaxID=1872122 RepID=UPI0039189B6D
MNVIFRASRSFSFAIPMSKAFWGLFIAVAAWHPQQAHAQTTVADNLAAPLEVAALTIDATQWAGFPFQVGATAQRIFEWRARGYNLGAPGNVTLKLFSLNAVTNLPVGAELASAVVAWDPTLDNTYSAAALGAIATTTLNANAKYALVFGPAAPGPYYWGFTSTVPPTFSSGFAAAGRYLVTTDSGATWSNNAGSSPILQLQVVAAPVVAPVATAAIPTLEVWSLSALGLLVAGVGAYSQRRRVARAASAG